MNSTLRTSEQPLLEQLTEAFRCLPGVGPKGAQRMVLHLLERDRNGGKQLATLLNIAMEKIGNCQSCRNLCEEDTCNICRNAGRETKTLCIVESPADLIAIEQSASYRGQYFVLMGNLSPIEGIGPDEIGIKQLLSRCATGVEELILAVSSTVEGEATAHYIAESVRPLGIQITRIAQGIPLGGELEFIDGNTLAHALQGRKGI